MELWYVILQCLRSHELERQRHNLGAVNYIIMHYPSWTRPAIRRLAQGVSWAVDSDVGGWSRLSGSNTRKRDHMQGTLMRRLARPLLTITPLCPLRRLCGDL